MRKITLVSIRLTNFKAFAEKEIRVSEIISTISGANGTGKSTLYNGIYWCLYGKDAAGRKDYCIVPRDKDGNEKHNLTTEVETLWLVDGEQVKLTRSYSEQYEIGADGTKSLKGHLTKCFINSGARKVSEFSDKVSQMFQSEQMFRVLTNPLFFCQGLDWKDRREILLHGINGGVTDASVAEGNPEFESLLEKLHGQTIEQLRQDTVSVRNKCKQELEYLQQRISQTEKLMPEAVNAAEAEKELKKMNKELAAITTNESGAMAQERLMKRAELTGKVHELKLKMGKLEVDAISAQCDKYNAEVAEYKKMQSLLEAFKTDRSVIVSKIASKKGICDSLQTFVNNYTTNINSLRDQYTELNASQFSGSNICPTCGQPLPQDAVEQARAAFESNKQKELASLIEKGKTLNAKIKEIKQQIEGYETEKKELEFNLSTLDQSAFDLQQKFESTPTPKRPVFVKEECDEYIAEAANVASLEAQIAQLDAEPQADNSEARANVEQRIKELHGILAQDVQRKKCAKELEELDEKMQDTCQFIADCQHTEDTIKEFLKKKISMLEDSINSKYETIKFKLFEFTLEGNPKEVCVPLIDGVPYEAANTASRINAGIEIIDSLCSVFNVCLPIWVDNAESCNRIIASAAQQIRLTVSSDNALTIL